MKPLALAISFVAAAALPLSASATSQTTTLKLVEVTTFEKLVVDSPPLQRSKNEPFTPGDVIAGRSKLLNGSKLVGGADFFGVVTAFPRFEFYGTFTLPGGTVSIVAVGNFAAHAQTFAIVGGTGRYTSARGTDREQQLAEGKSLDTFTITT